MTAITVPVVPAPRSRPASGAGTPAVPPAENGEALRAAAGPTP